ncbi:MAG TPA: NUDIX hydrolase [Candidatus Paceibacterota bacterium]
MSIKRCDHASVGALIYDANKNLLLIERKKYPYGWAPPAGHLDGDTFQKGLLREIREEVGLGIETFSLVLDRKFDNPCRREGGTWHHWQVFRADRWIGELKRSFDETKKAEWCSRFGIGVLAEYTKVYCAGKIPENEWERHPGIEPVWCEIFVLLNIL